MRPLTDVEQDRFWSKVSGGDYTDCWPWAAGKYDNGYGAFSIDQQNIGAHRVAYDLLVGAVPAGLHLDHLCHDPRACSNDANCPHRACVNPWHLEPVTPRVNGLRSGSPSALNVRKTHCPQGHEYAGENLLRYSGRRVCRVCERAKQVRYHDRHRADRPERLTCRQGHLWSESTRITPRGRLCVECERARKNRWLSRRGAGLIEVAS